MILMRGLHDGGVPIARVARSGAGRTDSPLGIANERRITRQPALPGVTLAIAPMLCAHSAGNASAKSYTA